MPAGSETQPAFATRLLEKFSSDVLAVVARLPPAVMEARQDPSTEFLDGILGKGSLAITGRVTYSLEPDNAARVCFKLTGNVPLFQEFHRTFLGERWRCEDAGVTVAVRGSRDAAAIRRDVQERMAELNAAIDAFTKQFAEARAALRSLANNAYWERLRLEETLREFGIEPARLTSARS